MINEHIHCATKYDQNRRYAISGNHVSQRAYDCSIITNTVKMSLNIQTPRSV